MIIEDHHGRRSVRSIPSFGRAGVADKIDAAIREHLEPPPFDVQPGVVHAATCAASPNAFTGRPDAPCDCNPTPLAKPAPPRIPTHQIYRLRLANALRRLADAISPS